MREVLFIVLAIAVAIILFAIGSRVRYAWLGKKRRASGFGFESFRSELGSRVSTEVCQIVYDFFFEITGKRMPVLASDDLGDLYGIVDEDLVDELRDLAVRCRAAAPTEEDAYAVGTVLDAALLMESLRHEDGRAPG